VRDGTVVSISVGGRDDGLEEVVGLLHLVPEQRVVLRELEVLDAQLGGSPGAQQVEAGEEPAASALLLVGHLAVGEQVGNRVVDRRHHLPVEGDVLDRRLRHGVLHELVLRVGVELLRKPGEVRLCETGTRRRRSVRSLL
jgi:hypothetical protein